MNKWTHEFDETLYRRYGIDIHDSGFTEEEVQKRWGDLTPKEAVEEMASKYDLQRVDTWG